MGRDTKIQWCDSTVNPVMGCDGCELWSSTRRTCYAGQLHGIRGGHKGYAASFDVPETFPGRMAAAAKWKPLVGKERADKPWLNGYPRMVFVSDMGDALSRGIGWGFLDEEIMRVVRGDPGRRHLWLWLTKRPSAMQKFLDWCPGSFPQNLWLMTSVTGSRTEARAESIAKAGPPEAVRGISFEPLEDEPDWQRCFGSGLIRWAIFGGESGNSSSVWSMDVAWVRRGIDACRQWGVAPFVKQLGARPVGLSIEGVDQHRGDWSAWPEDLRVREIPSLLP